MTVRRAKRSDAPQLLAMGRAMLQESPRFRAMEFDEKKVAALGDRISKAMMFEHAAVLVAERGGEIVGMMIVMAAERYFGSDRYATDLAVYVKPEQRGSMAFPRLIKAAEAWASERGISDCTFGVSTEVAAEQTAALYKRMGYSLSGYILRKQLE
jgi:GNAT superfamily N-acetyltransferase